MKRVLLVAYNFPPEPIAGALRPGYLAKYLPVFGWQPTILTHSIGTPAVSARVVHVGSASAMSSTKPSQRTGKTRPLRTILRAIKEFVLFPDEHAAWIPRAILRGLQLLHDDRYDAILSTALPASVHVVGGALSRLTGTPWIADYRDLWSQNPNFRRGPLSRMLHERVERTLVKRASHVTTVSEALAAELRRLHDRDVSAIENAFDPAEWDAIPNEPPTAFDLTYTGTMYAGLRSAHLLFAALRALRDMGHPLAEHVHVHFYGRHNESALDEAREFGMDDRVLVHAVVPRMEAMQAQRRAAALLIFLSTDPSTVSERGSKYLEYAGAHRPVLVFGPQQSALRQVVQDASMGWFSSDVDGAKKALIDLYERYRAGRFEMRADTSAIPTSIDLARQFASCLDGITAPERTHTAHSIASMDG